MNPSMNHSIQSPAGIRSDVAELQTLLMKSRSQVHEAEDRQQIPWQNTNMMRWDQRMPAYQQAEHDFNRGLNPSTFSNLKTSEGPSRRLSNFSSVECSPYGLSRGVKSIPSESLSRMNISSPNLGLKMLSRNGSSSGFPMPRLGGMGTTKKGPELVDLALSVANADQSSSSSRSTARSQQQVIPPLRKSHGCFPLPKLCPVKKSFKKPYSLASYKELWVSSQDGEVSREVFARRLQRGGLSSVRLLDKKSEGW
jgi:hypothetical protein